MCSNVKVKIIVHSHQLLRWSTAASQKTDQVCFQPSTAAVNEALLAFAAERRAAGRRRCRSISPARRSLSSKPAARRCEAEEAFSRFQAVINVSFNYPRQLQCFLICKLTRINVFVERATSREVVYEYLKG